MNDNQQALEPLKNARETYERYREYKKDCQYFNNALFKVMVVMPIPGFIQLPNGVMEQLPIPEKWQKKIDRINEECEIFLSKKYPEYYTLSK